MRCKQVHGIKKRNHKLNGFVKEENKIRNLKINDKLKWRIKSI